MSQTDGSRRYCFGAKQEISSVGDILGSRILPFHVYLTSKPRSVLGCALREKKLEQEACSCQLQKSSEGCSARVSVI